MLRPKQLTQDNKEGADPCTYEAALSAKTILALPLTATLNAYWLLTFYLKVVACQNTGSIH